MSSSRLGILLPLFSCGLSGLVSGSMEVALWWRFRQCSWCADGLPVPTPSSHCQVVGDFGVTVGLGEMDGVGGFGVVSNVIEILR